jgi:hypothetical protein
MPTTKLNNGQLPNSFDSKTIGTSNTINTNLTKLSIAGGSNGQVLSTNGSGALSWISLTSGDIDLGVLYDFGTFESPANYNLDMGAI